MKTLNILVKTPHGIHLRVASEIVRRLRNYDAEVLISKDGGNQARADSILDLMLLAVTENSQIQVIANGNDEQKVIDDIDEYFTDGAGI